MSTLSRWSQVGVLALSMAVASAALPRSAMAEGEGPEAEPAVDPAAADPPAADPVAAAGSGARPYANFSAGGAIITTDHVLVGGGHETTTGSNIVLRASAGLEVGKRCLGVTGRVGPYVDVYTGGGAGFSFGLEGQLEWTLADCTHLGLRLAAGPSSLDGIGATLTMFGVHLRRHRLTAGLDLFGGSSHGSSNKGVMLTGGFEGKYALVATGVSAALLGVFVMVGLSHSH